MNIVKSCGNCKRWDPFYFWLSPKSSLMGVSGVCDKKGTPTTTSFVCDDWAMHTPPTKVVERQP